MTAPHCADADSRHKKRAMSLLEKSVGNLATALDNLEAKLDGRLDDHSASGERVDAARRQARAARLQTETAARELSGAIAEVKALIAGGERKG